MKYLQENSGWPFHKIKISEIGDAGYRDPIADANDGIFNDKPEEYFDTDNRNGSAKLPILDDGYLGKVSPWQCHGLYLL